MNVPAATYAYVSGSGIDYDPTDFLTKHLKVLGEEHYSSAVPETKVNFLKLTAVTATINSFKQDYKNPMKLLSSQKKVKESEPDFTSLKQVKEVQHLTTHRVVKQYTEDYIFNTEKLLPVGYLSFPQFDAEYANMTKQPEIDNVKEQEIASSTSIIKNKGYFPTYDYPSDHLSIMTQYRFAKTD